jgi:translation initiation factor 2D
MRGGADLMTPGLAMGPPFPEKAIKGATVAIASYELPGIPMIVGECEIDVSALTSVRGAKGHAVKGIHWQGDEIWDWSQVNKPGTSPDVLSGWLDETEDTDINFTKKTIENLQIEEDGGVSLENNTTQDSKQNDNEKGEEEEEDDDDDDVDDGEDDHAEKVQKEWTTKGKLGNIFIELSNTRRN